MREEVRRRSLLDSVLSIDKFLLCCADPLGVPSSFFLQSKSSQLSSVCSVLCCVRLSAPLGDVFERMRAIGGSIPPFSSFLPLISGECVDGIPLSGRENTWLCAAAMLKFSALPCLMDSAG